jgi:hypothetical protein
MEIKIRLWDTIAKRMYLPEYSEPTDFFICPDGSIMYLAEVGHEGHLMNFPCKGGIPMLFTGVKDKNGKDIYEGDIVATEKWVSIGRYMPCKGILKYMSVGFSVDCIDDWEGSNADLNSNAEIIGNIYQNPELIKQNIL